MEKIIPDMKYCTVNMLGIYFHSGFYTLKLLILDHIGEDVRRFRNTIFLEASSLEHLNVVVKLSYRSTYRRTGKRMRETVERMETALAQLQSRVRKAVA